VGSGGSRAWHVVRGDVNVDLERPSGRLANFVVADAHSLPFQESVFGGVVCFDVAQYFHDPLGCFIEMCRVLKRHGSLVASVPNPLHYRRVVRYLLGKPIVLGASAEVPSDRHLQCWTDAEIKAVLLSAGFCRIRVSFVVPAYRLRRDPRRRIRLDKIVARLVRGGLGGRNMVVEAVKS